uniref:CLN6 transmembrane ER protein n=1 Tax=Sparus aurata TaxID=8175 RepID=A0A671TP49_SPAAU
MKPERLKTSSGCLFCLGPESVTCPGAELCRSAGSVEMEEVLSKPRFHLDLWLAFTLQNWILDVGRCGYSFSCRYVPLFLVLFLFFSGCFSHRKQEEKTPAAAWMLLIPNAAYYWYLITEGQTFILFIFTFFAMMATVMHKRRRGMVPDGNGLLTLYSFSAALVLVAVWVAWLWSDGVLRKKHSGLIYVPQPRCVYTLYLQQNNHT